MSIHTPVLPDKKLAFEAPPALERFALDWRHVLLVTWFAAVFLYLNNMPLFHSDIWGHVAYGDWILTHRSLPIEDPYVPFAEGVRMVDSAWLGQVALAGIEKWGGAAWLSNAYALLGTCTYLILGCAFALRGRRASMALVGAMLALGLSLTRIQIIRPENFGSVCFAIAILLVALIQARASTDDRDDSESPAPWGMYLCVPVVFLAWANLHGSFVVGLALFGCCALGRMLEVAFATRSLTAVIRDQWAFRWLCLTELAVAATLINPYGMDLLINAVTFPKNPNLLDVLEWEPLKYGSAEGVLVFASWVLLIALWRHSRRRILPSDVLLLAVFSYAVISSCRMIGWYAAVFTYTMAPHISGLAARFGRDRAAFRGGAVRFLAGPSPVHTAVCLLMLWYGFAFSHVATPLLGGTPRTADRIYSGDTPRGVTEFLRKFPPAGQIFNPQWWGDWLVWDGPRDLKVFMTTNAVHLAPNRFWKDYLRVSRAEAGWQLILDRYNVSTIVLHKKLQPALETEARDLHGWKVVYEDPLALIVTRDKQLIDAVKTGSGTTPTAHVQTLPPERESS